MRYKLASCVSKPYCNIHSQSELSAIIYSLSSYWLLLFAWLPKVEDMKVGVKWVGDNLISECLVTRVSFNFFSFTHYARTLFTLLMQHDFDDLAETDLVCQRKKYCPWFQSRKTLRAAHSQYKNIYVRHSACVRTYFRLCLYIGQVWILLKRAPFVWRQSELVSIKCVLTEDYSAPQLNLCASDWLRWSI